MLVFYSSFSGLFHQIHISSSFVSLGWKFIGDSSWHWWADEHHRLAGEQRGKRLQHPRHSDIPSGTLVQEVDHSSSKPSGLRLCRRNPSGLLGYRTVFDFCVFCAFDLNKGRIECNSLDSDNGLSRGKTDCTIDKPIFRSKIKVGRSLVWLYRWTVSRSCWQGLTNPPPLKFNSRLPLLSPMGSELTVSSTGWSLSRQTLRGVYLIRHSITCACCVFSKLLFKFSFSILVRMRSTPV